MSEDRSDLGILQALEDGRIDVYEAVRRLEAEPVGPPRAARPFRSWWLILLGAGMVFLGGGGMLASWRGWWWLAAVPLLLLGTLLAILAAAASTSPWILVRVRDHGRRSRRVWIPIPVRVAAWGVHFARPWARGMNATALGEVLLALERDLGSDRDLVIDVDDTGDGERVRVDVE